VSERFEVRKVADGWQVWDLRSDQAHQQPGLLNTHWWPPTARGRAQEWVDRQATRRLSTHASRNR
jgi:hypothetical protein